MSSFKYADRLKFEKLFGMEGGYVLWFSNRTFRDFFISTVDIDIYDGSIADNSLSKANLLRAFWEKADDMQIAKVNRELLKIWVDKTNDKSDSDQSLYDECVLINNKLSGISLVKNIDALRSIDADESLDAIIADIKHNIECNKPELTLDRLHNYLVNYGRKLCDKHGIRYSSNNTLNSLFGLYNKWLHDYKLLESNMSSKIIGSIVKLFDDFNYVRNNESAAHPNPLLNKIESLFIVDTICSIIEFINKIEDVLAGSLSNNKDEANLLPF
jgi:hypothetical protein